MSKNASHKTQQTKPQGVVCTALVRRLLRQLCAAARKQTALTEQITPLLQQRYGATPADVDCDSYIDAADYGRCEITLEELDEAMTECGCPPNTPSELPDGRSKRG